MNAAQTIDVLLGTWIVRVSGPPSIAPHLAAVLVSLRIEGDDPAPLEVTIAADERTALGAVAGRPLWSVSLPAGRGLSVLLGQVVATLTSLLERLLFVHAGAVVMEGRAWVLLGGSGAGKTSAVCSLLRRGAVYLSDELALLDPDEGTVVPATLPMAIKPWTAWAAGSLPRGREVACDGSARFWLPMERAAGPVRAHAFVRLGRAGRAARLVPLSRAGMLLAIAGHPSSFCYRHRVEDAFVGFGRVLRTAQCFALEARNPAACADMLVSAGRATDGPATLRRRAL